LKEAYDVLTSQNEKAAYDREINNTTAAKWQESEMFKTVKKSANKLSEAEFREMERKWKEEEFKQAELKRQEEIKMAAEVQARIRRIMKERAAAGELSDIDLEKYEAEARLRMNAKSKEMQAKTAEKRMHEANRAKAD